VGAKPVTKKTASPGLQARRAAAAKAVGAKKTTADTPTDTPTDTPASSPNGTGAAGGVGPVNGATPTDTPSTAANGKRANSKKGSAARRLSG
jgi:hypothetical protein